MKDVSDVITRLTRVYGDNVLVRKCGVGECLKGGRGIAREDGSPLLYFSQYYADTTNFVEIIDTGPDCKWFRPEHSQVHRKGHWGESTLCPETADGMRWVTEHYWFIKEEVLYPIVFGDGGIKAIGDCVLVLIPEKNQDALIVTPDVIDDKENVYQVHSTGPSLSESIPDNCKVLGPSQVRVFNVNGVKYGCIRETEIFAVLE